jgi:hypothetical protein
MAPSKLRALPTKTLQMKLVLPPPHQALWHDAGDPVGFLGALRRNELAGEAITFLSYALPEREAVWWACMCVLHTAPATLAPEQHHALTLAQEWVRKPTEDKRRQAKTAAREAGDSSATAFLARAVFASRLADPDSLRAGRRVEAAIRRAADGDGTGRKQVRLHRFIASAEDIGTGGAGRLPPGGEE